ncbi:hypothetical protein BDR22DRAFT_823671 [Usnea florida]
MALVMTPELLGRFITFLQPMVSTSAIILLGSAASFAPHYLRSPVIEAAQREIGEFAFHNGALLAHHQYLYGVDQNGEPYIVGKKLAGHDYSAWEAEYAKFPRLGPQTIERPESKVTYSWSLEAPQTSTNQNFLWILLWLVFALFCAAVFRYLAQRGGNGNRIGEGLARELLRKYREGKSQILSLTERVFHLNDDFRKTRKLVRKERKKAARTAILRMKSVHDRELQEQQEEIERLQGLLDSFPKSSGHADAEAQTDNPQAPSDIDQPAFSSNPITNPEDAAVEDGDVTAEATGTADEGQDEKSPAVDEQRAGLGDEDPASAAEQGDGPSTPNEPQKKQRVNRRKDGSIRTASHPDHTPSQNSGRGGRARGGNWDGRGGRGRGHFGWRGGRNERGWGGRGGGYGPYDQQ